MAIYSRLEASYSNIEGMDMMAAKFNVVVTGMRKKQYDYLDQRKTDFDTDFEEFKRQIADLHVGFIRFSVTCHVYLTSRYFLGQYSKLHGQQIHENVLHPARNADIAQV